MSKKVILTREAILQAQDIEIREVEVPEWGGTVHVRGMSGLERDNYESSLYVQRGKDRRLNTRNARAKLCAFCAVDPKGNRLFTDKDLNSLSGKSSKALDRIFAVAMEMSGISEDDMEELTKNSEEMAFEDSFID